jgi:hypothetical protein
MLAQAALKSLGRDLVGTGLCLILFDDFEPSPRNPDEDLGSSHVHRRRKAGDRKQITSEFPAPDPYSAAEMLHGRRSTTDFLGDLFHRICYEQLTHLVDFLFDPGTSRRLLLCASVDENHTVSPRAPGSLLQLLDEWFNLEEVQGARLACNCVRLL